MQISYRRRMEKRLFFQCYLVYSDNYFEKGNQMISLFNVLLFCFSLFRQEIFALYPD